MGWMRIANSLTTNNHLHKKDAMDTFAIELTPEVVAAVTGLAFWVGRMSKTAKRLVEVEYRDKTVEKKIEVPTVVYKCQHDCVSSMAHEMFDKIATGEFDYSDNDELIEQQKERADVMERCMKMARELHSPQKLTT